MNSRKYASLQIVFSPHDPKTPPKDRKPCICKDKFNKFLLCDLTERKFLIVIAFLTTFPLTVECNAN